MGIGTKHGNPLHILNRTLLTSVLAVVRAGLPVPALELGGDANRANELLSQFHRLFAEVFIVCHTVAKGVCEVIDDDIDPYLAPYFGIDVQSINLIEILLNSSRLPELVCVQVCPICGVMLSMI